MAASSPRARKPSKLARKYRPCAELLQYPVATFDLWVKKWEEQGLIETRKNGKLTTFLLTHHKDGQDAH